jgi:hypothetical protein
MDEHPFQLQKVCWEAARKGSIILIAQSPEVRACSLSLRSELAQGLPPEKIFF